MELRTNNETQSVVQKVELRRWYIQDKEAFIRLNDSVDSTYDDHFVGCPCSEDEITGESLEVSALPGLESRVANGEYTGKTLRDLLPLWGKQLTGANENGFPLLLKLLDTRQPLSVQVHPDDSYALSHEGKPGKSEAWYILDAAPGAQLVYGIDTHGKSLRSVLDEGRLA